MSKKELDRAQVVALVCEKRMTPRVAAEQLGLVVRHNMSFTQPGAGSAIFLHPWRADGVSTLGCTAMERAKLIDLIGWLQPAANPVLVQVAVVLL